MNIWCKIAVKLNEQDLYFKWNKNTEFIEDAGELVDEIFDKEVIGKLTEEDIEDLTAFRIAKRVDFYVGLADYVIEYQLDLLEYTIENILDSLTWFFSPDEDERIIFIRKFLGWNLDLDNLDPVKETIARLFWENIKDLVEKERDIILGDRKIYDKFGHKFEKDYWVKKLEKDEWIDYADLEILKMLFETPEEKLLPFARDIAIGAETVISKYFNKNDYIENFINLLQNKEYYDLIKEINKYTSYFSEFIY